MSDWKSRNRIPTHALSIAPARTLIAAALAVGLAACNAQMSASSTSNVPDPPAPGADLPEIVVTAHALHPGDGAEDAARDSKDRGLAVPADLAESRDATARKARVASGAADETG
jgi:hypothetical protein